MVEKIKAFKLKKNLIIAFVCIITGMFLIIYEIYDFFRLPSKLSEINQTISYLKYKEDTLFFGYLWSLVLFLGISFFISKKINWIFSQLTIFTYFVMFFAVFISISSKFNSFSFISFDIYEILFVLVSFIITFMMLLFILRLYKKEIRKKQSISFPIIAFTFVLKLCSLYICLKFVVL